MGQNAESVAIGAQLGIAGYGMFGALPERDLPATLAIVAESGATGVEVMSNLLTDGGVLASACADAGLVVCGVHLGWPELTESALDAVERLHSRYLIVSELPPLAGPDTAATIDTLLGWADRATAAGARMLFHNHAADCAALADGRTPVDIVAAMTPPGSVDFLIDLFWAMRGGADSPRLFSQLRGRCPALHLKDGPRLEAAETPGRSYGLGEGDVALATGVADAALHNDLEWVIIERDLPAADPRGALASDLAVAVELLAGSARRPAGRHGTR